MKNRLIATLLLITNCAFATGIQKGLERNYDLVKANDKAVVLLGKQVQVGEAAPDFKVVDGKFNPKSLSEYAGKPVLISVVPSLDTGICSLQTKRFNDEVENMPQDVIVLTISTDLPFAQKRFCQTEEIDKLETLSDAVWRDFGIKYGLLIENMGLLSRAILVVSPEQKLIYKEIVKDLSEQPDYDAALATLQAISEQSEKIEN